METRWKSLFSKLTNWGVLFALVAGPGLAFGQATPAPAAAPAAPAADAPPQILGMDFTGFADVGYTSFSTGKGTFINTGHARTFDWENGVASVQNVDLQLQKTPDSGFGGLIDLSIGKDADTIGSYGMVDKDKGPYFGDVGADGKTPSQKYWDVTQLYAYYGMGSVNFLLGKYATHAGQEVIKSRDDTNFSRSILFGFAIPFTHTGVRATYKPADTLTLMLGANEGWDTIVDKNKGTTGEFDWEWSPSKAFSFFGTYLSGEELLVNYPSKASVCGGSCANFQDSPHGQRSLVDLLFTYNATDSLSFVLNYDSGTQAKATLINGDSGTATWSGYALYANYGINDNWRLSVRAESFDDHDAFRTAALESGKTKGPVWSEGTVTVAYMGIKKIEIRGEVRSDSADQKIFSNAAGDQAIATMTSVALEALYKF